MPSEAALGTASSAALPPAPAQASADPARAAQGGFTPAAQASAATDPAGRAPEARPEAAPATQAPAELLQLVPQQAPAEMSDDGFDTERAQLQAQLEQRQGEKSEGQVMRKPAAAQKGASAVLRKPAASDKGAGPAKKKPPASHQGAGPAKKKPAAVQKGGLKEKKQASSAVRAVNPSTEKYATMLQRHAEDGCAAEIRGEASSLSVRQRAREEGAAEHHRPSGVGRVGAWESEGGRCAGFLRCPAVNFRNILRSCRSKRLRSASAPFFFFFRGRLFSRRVGPGRAGGPSAREASSSWADRQPPPQHLSERRERERERNRDKTYIYILIYIIVIYNIEI